MKRKQNKNNTDYSLAHVLYQKLGTDWYAFTEVDGDCFMTKVDAATAEKEASFPSDVRETDSHSRGKRKVA